MATKEAANGASQSEDEVTQAATLQAAPVSPPAPIKPVLIKPINIELDPDQPEDYYQLRMTNKAMQLIEETIGINMWEGLGGISNIKPRNIAVMIWACLLWKFPDLKLEDLESLPGMDMANFLYVVTTLDKVVYGHLPEPEPVKEGESDPNVNPSAGSNSGQSDA